MALEPVFVTIADDHLDDVAGVVRSLRDSGMHVEQVLDRIGMVSGTVAASALGALAQLPGISAVEPPATFRLPPPDSPVQ
jgi:hypothetical protein